MSAPLTIYGFLVHALVWTTGTLAVAYASGPPWVSGVLTFQAGMWFAIGLAYRAGWRKQPAAEGPDE